METLKILLAVLLIAAVFCANFLWGRLAGRKSRDSGKIEDTPCQVDSQLEETY